MLDAVALGVGEGLVARVRVGSNYVSCSLVLVLGVEVGVEEVVKVRVENNDAYYFALS